MKGNKNLIICLLPFFCISSKYKTIEEKIFNSINLFESYEIKIEHLEYKKINDFNFLVKDNNYRKVYYLNNDFDISFSTTDVSYYDNNFWFKNNDDIYNQYNKEDKSIEKSDVSAQDLEGIFINNGNNLLNIYESSYMNEVKLIGVPNYPNYNFAKQGCVPTSFLMYLAFMNNYSNDKFGLRNNFPINYDDNENEIDNKIIEIGKEYFFTTNKGTPHENVIPGILTYFENNNYVNYDAKKTSYISTYQNMILNYKNPCLINVSFYEDDGGEHYLLGIGYKLMFDGIETIPYIIANEASGDGIIEVVFKAFLNPYNPSDYHYRYHIKDFIIIGD